MQYQYEKAQSALTQAKTFFAAHAAELGDAVQSPALIRIDGVLKAMNDAGAVQVGAGKASLGGTAVKKRLRRTLREANMAPISSIATSELEGLDVVALAKFRLPGFHATDAALLTAARAMVSAAQLHHAELEAQKLPSDFLPRLIKATDDFAAAIVSRNAQKALLRNATKKVPVLGKQVRQILRALTGVVQSRFSDRPEVMAEWRSVTRIGAKPGVARGTLRKPAAAEAAPLAKAA